MATNDDIEADTRQRTHKIQRLFKDSSRRVTIRRGLTLDQAQTHCCDPETSSSTCTNAAGKRRTRRYGMWFDSYTEEKPR